MRVNSKESKLRRREFLELGATTTAMAALGVIGPADKAEGRIDQSAKPVFRTSLCDLLGVEYPIIQAGMSGVAGPELVAAVSEAGGLGVMTGALTPPAELREKIQRIRKLTDRPFGVNLLLHTDLRPPKDAARIPDDLAHKVQAQLNRFRERLGIAKSASRPGAITDKFTGMYARTLRNTFTEEYEASGAPPLPPFFQFLAMGDIVKATAEKGSGEYYPLYAGQGVGSLRDLPRAADIVQTLAREAQAVIVSLQHRVRSA